MSNEGIKEAIAMLRKMEDWQAHSIDGQHMREEVKNIRLVLVGVMLTMSPKETPNAND